MYGSTFCTNGYHYSCVLFALLALLVNCWTYTIFVSHGSCSQKSIHFQFQQAAHALIIHIYYIYVWIMDIHVFMHVDANTKVLETSERNSRSNTFHAPRRRVPLILILNTTHVVKCVCLEGEIVSTTYYDGQRLPQQKSQESAKRRGDQSDRSQPPTIGDARELLTDDSDTTGVC